MALVPHKITALAESDAEGTDGKNIVAGAVVSLYDTDGSAVTLFDSESGTNGSTAKQTDSTGQVVVWITAGEYDEEVNGSIKRRVNVGGNSVVSYETTESLQASRPNKTGQRAENRELINAQYTLAPSGYAAVEGDRAAANGRVWKLDDIKNLKAYGAEGDASGVWAILQGAVDRLAALGGGTLQIPNGRYGLEQTLVIPKDANISLVGERVSKSSSLSANADEAGVEIYAVNVMDEMIEWNGETSVDTSANELGRGLYIRDMHLNGNNKAVHLIDCLNIDLLDIQTCRLTGAENIIRSTFNGTYTSALLAGGLRVYNCTFGASSGAHVELDGQTQCWFAENWFAGTGSGVDFIINRSSKINIINNEFNNASDAVFRLTDGTGNEATQDIIINDNKIALADGTVTVIDDQRQLVTSKRISFVGNTVVNGAGIDPHSLHNPKSNTFAYSQTSSSKMYAEKVECNESIVNDTTGLSKLTKYQTDSIQRFNAGVNSDAESGDNEGSNYVIQRFDDAGDLLGTEFFIDRETGRVYYKNVSATGNGSTVDGTTGQIATDSLTTAAGASTTISFSNPRVNFTPVICQLRSYAGAGEPIISKVTTGTGTFSVTIRNIGSSALNAPVNFMFHAL